MKTCGLCDLFPKGVGTLPSSFVHHNVRAHCYLRSFGGVTLVTFSNTMLSDLPAAVGRTSVIVCGYCWRPYFRRQLPSKSAAEQSS
jgi:hypothetical protein